MGTKTWYVEATTYGRVKAGRKVDITIICGVETVTCVSCKTRTVVYDRNIIFMTPHYEVQSLTNPSLERGWFAYAWFESDNEDCPITKYELLDDPSLSITSTQNIILREKNTPRSAWIDVDTTTP